MRIHSESLISITPHEFLSPLELNGCWKCAIYLQPLHTHPRQIGGLAKIAFHFTPLISAGRDQPKADVI
jgi:hypothetical protein